MTEQDKQLLLVDLCSRLPQEEWRIIPDFLEYTVSNKGNIITLKTGKIWKNGKIYQDTKECIIKNNIYAKRRTSI